MWIAVRGGLILGCNAALVNVKKVFGGGLKNVVLCLSHLMKVTNCMGLFGSIYVYLHLQLNIVSSSHGGWVVRAVALQSSKRVILLRPRFESRSRLWYWLFKIRNYFTPFKLQDAGWPMAAYNIKQSEGFQNTQWLNIYSWLSSDIWHKGKSLMHIIVY